MTTPAKTEVVIVVEDQVSIASLINVQLEKVCDLPILVLQSYAEVEEVLAADVIIRVAMCDLTLPDAPKGETVGLLRKHKIPTVVLTGTYKEETRQQMMAQLVCDYVLKDSAAAIQYAVNTVVRLLDNPNKSIWLLSSASHSSQKLFALLKIQKYDIWTFDTFSDIERELTFKKPNLLLLDNVSQIENNRVTPFVQKIRAEYSPSELPIISCETSDNISTAIKLMKYGVNDFFNTNFTPEELYVRVAQSIHESEYFERVQTLSRTDYMTGLSNRRYFFEQANALHAECIKNDKPYFIVMGDIDFFKRVNDTFGHQVGDDAICYTANAFTQVYADHIVARFGGEEFCVMGQAEPAEVEALAEKIRQLIESESELSCGAKFTLSQGFSTSFDTVSNGILKADEALYASKENGRNRVSIAD